MAPTIFMTEFAILFLYIANVWPVKDAGDKNYFFLYTEQSNTIPAGLRQLSRCWFRSGLVIKFVFFPLQLCETSL